VVESLLQDGYSAEEIGAFYGLTARRVRRFLRRHGLEEPAETAPADPWDDTARGYRAAPGRRGEDAFASDWTTGTPPRPPAASTAGRRAPRLSAAQLDELCALYLDPSLSLTEVAAYFDIDADAALDLINQRLTGIVPRPQEAS
jgi:hypothetical protein